MQFQTYTILFIIFKAIYYMAFIPILFYDKNKFFEITSLIQVFITVTSGFISLLIANKISFISKGFIIKSLKSFVYSKLIYEFYLMLKVYFNNKNADIGIFVISICIFNFIRSLSKNFFLSCFDYERKLAFFNDTLDLEKHFYTLFTGKDLNAENLINTLRNSPKYDSKTLFCILCDNPVLSQYAPRFWELSVYKDYSMTLESSKIDSDFNPEILKEINSPTPNDVTIKPIFNKSTQSKTKDKGNQENFNINGQCIVGQQGIKEERTNSAFSTSNGQNNLENLEMRGKITLESLSKYFRDSRGVFKILTQGLDTELEYQDFHDNIRQLNIERTSYLNFIDENSRITSMIARIHWAVYSLVILVAAVQLFGNDGLLKFAIYPFILFLFPIGFNMMDSFFFLIYMHPFDIGDRIFIEEENLIVKSLRLTSVVFERWNNEIVIYTNKHLRSKILRNIRRSKSQAWSVSTIVSKKYIKKIRDLEVLLKNFCKENNAFEGIVLTCDEVVDNSFIKISLLVKHSINYQNGYFMCYVQNRFMKKFIFFLNSLKIKFDPIEHPVFLDGKAF